MIKLRMLDALSNEGQFYQTSVNEGDLIKAMGVLNEDEHKEYLSNVFSSEKEGEFVIDDNAKKHLGVIVGDVNAPASLRQASHLLLYHGGNMQNQGGRGNQKTVFSFDSGT